MVVMIESRLSGVNMRIGLILERAFLWGNDLVCSHCKCENSRSSVVVAHRLIWQSYEHFFVTEQENDTFNGAFAITDGTTKTKKLPCPLDSVMIVLIAQSHQTELLPLQEVIPLIYTTGYHGESGL